VPPQTPPPPPKPTPLDPPQIYYNLKWRVPPLVVTTQEQADALDPNEWTLDPGNPAAAGAATTARKPPKEQYPKLFYNVNVPPQTVSTQDEEKALSGDWKEYQFSEAMIKAAYENLKMKQAEDARKAAASAQSGQAQQGQYPPQQYPQYPQYGYPGQTTGTYGQQP